MGIVEVILLALIVMVPVSVVLMQMFFGVPRISRGDPNDTVDDNPEKDKALPYRVVFLKCVRLRYWFPAYVLGYYRWKWVARLACWWAFHSSSGDCWIESTSRHDAPIGA